MAKKKAKSIIDDSMFTSLDDFFEETKKVCVIPVSPALDIKLHGGLPEGSLMLVRALPKTGKTVLLTQIAVNALRQGRYVFFADTERRLLAQKYFSEEIKEQYSDKLKFIRSKKKEKPLSGEQIYKTIYDLMKLPKYTGSLFIVDSLSSIVPQATLDDDEIKSDRRDTVPKLNADAMKKLGNLLRINSCILIGTQHLITDTSPGPMSGRLIPVGGIKLEFDADIVLDSRHRPYNLEGESVKTVDGEDLTGQLIKWDLTYNKLGPPYISKSPDDKIHNYIKFGQGVFWAKEAFSVLKDLGLVSVAGSWITLTTESLNEKIQGQEKMIDFIDDNRESIEPIIKNYMLETYNVSYEFEGPTVEEE